MCYCKSCFNEKCIKRWIERKIDALEYKGNECEDCNLLATRENYVVFDFHHLDPSTKEVSWQKLRLRSWTSIQEELDKCVLLCSNCHRLRHYKLALSN